MVGEGKRIHSEDNKAGLAESHDTREAGSNAIRPKAKRMRRGGGRIICFMKMMVVGAVNADAKQTKMPIIFIFMTDQTTLDFRMKSCWESSVHWQSLPASRNLKYLCWTSELVLKF